jgi:hypothetical protein
MWWRYRVIGGMFSGCRFLSCRRCVDGLVSVAFFNRLSRCSRSGSAFILVSWIRIRITNTEPDPGGLKLFTKVKKIQDLMCQMFSFEGWRLLLYCSLDVLYGGLGMVNFLYKKKIFFSAVIFSNFWSSKPWIRIRIRIRIRIETNADPQHWAQHCTLANAA